jgi:anoctamin-10
VLLLSPAIPSSVAALPGHPDRKVMLGAPVLSSYHERRLLTVFPLHDVEQLEQLQRSWSWLKPPVELVRNYFGESVALYWSFAETYTWFLTLVAALGAAEFVCEYNGVNYIGSNLLFSFFNLLCLAVFFEAWKRKAARHSFHWGTAGKLRRKPPRPEYRGELATNPTTGRPEMYYPANKRVKKILLVSLPITVLCLLLAFGLMLASFEADRLLAELLVDPETGETASDFFSKILLNLPSVAYSLSILVFNKVYLKLARRLTTSENHRTEEQHDTHITIKLITFEFVNTFMALFYLGLYQRDLAGLRAQLFTTLIVQQVVNQVQEVAIPLVLHRPAAVKLINKMSEKMGVVVQPEMKNIKGVVDLKADDDMVRFANHDRLAEPLDSLHDDFMELWLQFGHVFLFSAVYPLAACFAFANNLTELYADRYKLCRLSRKPKVLAVRDIGAWYLAFRITALLSIISNCTLLALDLRDSVGADWTDIEWFGMFVLIEHIFLVLFLGVNQFISDTPKDVKLAQDQADFHFRHQHVKHKRD